MSSTNFPFGMNVLTGHDLGIMQGKVFFVKPGTGSDGNDGLSTTYALKTLARAKALMTANQNDVCYLMFEGNTASLTTDYQATALDWSKDGCHLIGVNCGSFLGQRSRIAQLSTVKTIEDLFTVSANNCFIANIEVYQGVASSTATAPRAAVVSGQRNRIVNCQFSGNGDLAGSTDTAGARSLAVTGSENVFQKCYIGLDTVIRTTQTTEVLVSGCARTIFEDCIFNTYTSSTAFIPIQCTTIDRFVLFENCKFFAVAGITSAAVPTGLLVNTTPNGRVYFNNPFVAGIAQVTTADSTTVRVLGHDGTATGHLIGIATLVDAA